MPRRSTSSTAAAANKLQANIDAGITSHTDTLYVYNANTGFTSYPLSSSAPSANPNDLAIAIPGVGAYIGGASTRGAHLVPHRNAHQLQHYVLLSRGR